MKNMKRAKATLVIALCVFFLGVVIFESCKDKAVDENEMTASSGVVPQNFPAGINFPVAEDTINQWLANQDTVSITNHAWDIWAGLTAKTNQVMQGDSLRVFETWAGVADLVQFCIQQNEKGALLKTKKGRASLSAPRQFEHALLLAGKNVVDTSKGFSILVTVCYNIPAANFATSNLIFRESSIKQYWKDGSIGSIPAFPNDAITTKPTYYAGKADSLTGLIRVPTWPGIPGTPKVYPDTEWGCYVFVDTTNKQQEGKVAVPITSDHATPAQKAAATVNLKDFIHYRIDAATATYLNGHEDFGNNDFVAGDFVLLVGMHVATKEISNWTWQTFFWSPNPANPLFPASSFTASKMPASLDGAAKHYAMTTAYAMVWPNQPINGGKNVKTNTPIIAFNPYLEAGLTGLGGRLKNDTFGFAFGIQTNCMSCHALAAQNFGSGLTAPYTTAQYISMNDTSIFKSQVQLDFAWSIQGNIIKGK